MAKTSAGAEKVNNELALEVLDQIPTPVMAVDLDFKVIFMNEAGKKMLGKPWKDIKGRRCHSLVKSAHCETSECRMKMAMETGEAQTVRNELTINGRKVPIEYTAAPLRDPKGNLVGGLEYIIDITRRVQDEERLRAQSRTIQEISTPAIQLWDGILVLPVVGVVDSMRAQQMMDAILKKILETTSRIIILDIQGVAAVDTAVANHLLKITKATKLMGCPCVISGISPAVAQTLVQLGVNLGDVATNSTLRDALADAFKELNFDVIKRK